MRLGIKPTFLSFVCAVGMSSVSVLANASIGILRANWADVDVFLNRARFEREVLATRPPLFEVPTSAAFDKTRADFISWGYHEGNTELLASDDTLPSSLVEAISALGLSKPRARVYKQMPGNAIPPHVDTYNSYCMREGISAANVTRYLIFLEDRHLGHVVELGGELLNWRKGDIVWIGELEHLSVNAGSVPKLTLQVTGIVTEAALHLRMRVQGLSTDSDIRRLGVDSNVLAAATVSPSKKHPEGIVEFKCDSLQSQYTPS